ncbi:MAG: thiamine-monophosphate kinase [Chloroflexi bacterium]|nr:thiamine-monophosphate kinase [Chloroflexota bacterium]
MDVSDLGEFALIERLAAAVSHPPPESLLVGIGDDAAAWRTGEGVVLATTDTLVEGVHFLPESVPWRDLGWKALAVNVSDIAAMGGAPQFALVTLAVPPPFPVEAADELYAGLDECARAYDLTIAGGDVVRSDKAAVTVALLGHAGFDEYGEPLLLRRDAARPGDAIAVTGSRTSATCAV